MKRYPHYRIGLLVGLLTLNTLSACVNTREELGVRNRRHEWGCTAGNMRRSWNGSSPCRKATYIGGVGVIGVSLLAAPAYYFWRYFASSSTALGPSMNNGTNLTTLSPFTDSSTTTLPYNNTILDELQENVTKAIKDGEEKWGNGSSTEAPLSSTTEKPSSTTSKRLSKRLSKKTI